MFNKKIIFLAGITLIFGGLLIPFNVEAAETLGTEGQPEILTLEKCIELALQNSKDLQLASKQVAIKKAALKQAIAGFGPSVKYNYSVSEFEEKSAEVETNGGSLSIEQPLYMGGMLKARYQIAKLDYEKALEDERSAKQQTIYAVMQCFYGVWLAEQRLQITQASYDYMGRLYQQTKRFYDVGTKSKFELLTAQTEWEKRKPVLIEAQNDVIKAKLRLANLIGLPQEKSFNVQDELSQYQLPEKSNFTLQVLLDEAFQHNPGMLNAVKDLEIVKNKVKLARAGYKPTVAASVQKSKRDSDPSNPDLEEDRLTIGVNLSGVLFDSFKTQSAVSEAKKELEAQKIVESKKRDDLRLSVQEALLDVEASLEKAKASQASSNLAKEKFRMTQARYEAGMATTMDISEDQIMADEALIGYYKGIQDYIIAIAKLDVTLGRDPQSKE